MSIFKSSIETFLGNIKDELWRSSSHWQLDRYRLQPGERSRDGKFSPSEFFSQSHHLYLGTITNCLALKHFPNANTFRKIKKLVKYPSSEEPEVSMSLFRTVTIVTVVRCNSYSIGFKKENKHPSRTSNTRLSLESPGMPTSQCD